MSVKIEYTGRLDNSSGLITMGIGFTGVTDATTPLTQENGLLPDVNYSVLQAVEDLPYARSVPITDTLKAVFVPQDYTLLNLKSPLDSNTTVIPQRLFILITGGPPSQIGVCRVTFTQNWEAVPSIASSDIMTTTINPYPLDFDAR
jgi:hypothetical protein